MELGKSIDEIEIGEKASLDRTFSAEDVELFARLTGDFTPYHLDEEVARQSIFGRRIVHGMLTASLVSVVCSNVLPGYGAYGIDVYVKLIAPVFIGDTVTAGIEVIEKSVPKNRIKVRLNFTNQEGKTVLIGESWCSPPIKGMNNNL